MNKFNNLGKKEVNLNSNSNYSQYIQRIGKDDISNDSEKSEDDKIIKLHHNKIQVKINNIIDKKPERLINKTKVILDTVNEKNDSFLNNKREKVTHEQNKSKKVKVPPPIQSEIVDDNDDDLFGDVNPNITNHYQKINFYNFNQQEKAHSTEEDNLSEESKELEIKYIPKEKRTQLKINTDLENKEQIASQIRNEIIKESKEIDDKQKVILDYDSDDLDDQSTYLPNDKDNYDDLNAFSDWKTRELSRIEFHSNQLKQKLEEKEEIMRRRELTDEQVLTENLKLGSDATLQPFRSKYTYMQKYYAKPVFYQDSKEMQNNLNNRDINLQTEDDQFNISLLPKILQKRKGDFGKKGQSKHTHLADVDTTEFNPEYKIPQNVFKSRK